MTERTDAPIVLITGPPGGGKTTVARLVAEAFDRSTVVEADVVRESIVGGFVEPVFPFTPELVEQFALQRSIVVEWARRMAAAGYVTVIDDAPIPPDGGFERQYAALLADPATRCVVLRADANVVRDRIRARAGTFDEFLLGVVDHALSMLDDFDDERWTTVDSTDLSIDDTVAAVVAAVRSGHRAAGGPRQ